MDEDGMTSIKQNKFISQKDLDQWASHYAQMEKDSEEHDNNWLIFHLGNERFMVSLNDLEEATMVQNGIRLTSASMNIMGLMNLRGGIVIIADLGQIIGIRNTPEPHDKQRILFISDTTGQNIGYLVDSVEAIDSLDRGSYKESMADDKNITSHFIQFIGENKGKPVACIDIPAVLRETWRH
ncbi:MAG: purine-binding chemotaxis protein CheW [Candidatus Magnetoglobus multicellularis str. Araruama]|uniref:Purine-binding chemotaxis protein CheW n=1 Tax=Candidatus Magnetoglobus multicellularis str. Araruama TaxID=890399 RepID=A0A1V1PGR6_9BACT|nr:MAG: purine-binding chemotaxis protein CheW [Candidatus Magnetoglobus multicellularis str. Araruama]